MPDSNKQSPAALVDHFFRHEYAKIVSSLVRRFGAARLETIEDAVQSTLALALTSWAQRGLPERPGAWLTRVAGNQVIDSLRRKGAAQRAYDKPSGADEASSLEPSASRLATELDDDQLRMLFVCCDEALPSETRLVLALKILCGFGTREIALRLLTSEANVYKRLGRGRAILRERGPELDTPSDEQLRLRLGSVHRVLYLLFNEGYSSAVADQVIRRELCEEAVRLMELLAAHPVGDHPESWALLALAEFHLARLSSRVDGKGAILLLDQQDRSLWQRERIERGFYYLHRSASGDVFSRYHAEAGVLAEHCRAPSFAATDWREIVHLYALLESMAPSPLHTLNRAVAVAEWKGALAGLEVLQDLERSARLEGYYLWDATEGELKRRAGLFDEAAPQLADAKKQAPTDAERKLLARRLELCAQRSTDRS